MRRMRKHLVALVAIAVLGLTLLAPATNASADPPTFNPKVTNSLYVYTDGFTKQQKLDLSYTWLDEFTDTYDKYIAHGYRPTWPASLPGDIRDIIANGGSYGIYEVITDAGRTIEFTGTDDPHATCDVEVYANTADAFVCKSSPGYKVVRFSYLTHNSYGGNGGCQYGTCTSTGMNVYADPQIQPGSSEYGRYPFIAWLNQLDGYEFYVMNFDITYPPGYTGTVIPTSRPAPKYVAMGDSYSSGEGNLPYEQGSDNNNSRCHRSTKAYPRLLQSSMSLGPTAFVACSGAISDFVTKSNNTENPELVQAYALSQETEVVTLSIGGNDVGFADTLVKCVASTSAQGCLNAISETDEKISSQSFNEDLEDTFQDIRTATSTQTKVIVLGYPNLFPNYSLIDSGCSWGGGSLATLYPELVSGRQITEAEVDGLRSLHDNLNSVIYDAVISTGGNTYFVDPTIEFIGHEVCGPLDEWVNGVYLNVNVSLLQSGSYHPNTLGQSALAVVVKAKLNTLNQ